MTFQSLHHIPDHEQPCADGDIYPDAERDVPVRYVRAEKLIVVREVPEGMSEDCGGYDPRLPYQP